MNVLYFTCFEVTKGSNIHRNQVISLQGNGVDYKFLFISPLLIFNRKGLAVNDNRFNREDVKEIKVPMISYPFYLYIPLIPVLLFFTIPILWWYIKKNKFQVIHCRNMLSSLTAILVKKVFRVKCKIVCDPRSVYVEEGVIYKVYKYDGWTYRTWKKIERWVYKNSDACLGLSVPFMDYLKVFQKRSLFIPAIVSNSFSYDGERRKKIRNEMGISEDVFVAIYVGSIGSWHSIDAFIRMVKVMKENIQHSFKIILLTGNQFAITRLKESFPEEDILKVGTVNPEMVLDYLLVSDYGLLPGADTEGYEYDLLYKTMLSSKAEEYLCAGLPILVNKRIKSVSDLIENYKCGTVFNADGFNIVQNLDRQKFSEGLKDLFCVKSVVANYNKLYNELLQEL